MKRLVMIACVLAACCTIARPGPFRPVPPPRHFHHLPSSHYYYQHSYVSPWLGLTVGTFVGSAIANNTKTIIVLQPVVTTPAVTTPIVTTPAVTTPAVTIPAVIQPTQVWVEGRYIHKVQPNGAVLRIWIPGHWETK